ncbi:tRNA preQ1(34) S-adenosylmethionine ribosyltransferase-isomerase QueA [Candidatus Sumerlaeota bacterium]|nr:tRNA preQ1(34) S-adenosylmethionine ribosyltransferase-isomerase QueA [Candidatus Sumerlaeota bacterium]
MQLSDFNYELPPELVARHPAKQRDASRLMVLNRARQTIEHRHFRDLPELLRSGDLLVMNDSRVIPARLFARRAGGGRAEILLVEAIEPSLWIAIVRPGKALKPGVRVTLEGAGIELEIIEAREAGERVVRIHTDNIDDCLKHCGHVPLPPYILSARKEFENAVDPAAEDGPDDRERYQTVYAHAPGSVAAPTAGLHFTDALLEKLRAQGIAAAHCTLHVGPGTFMPIKTERIEDHRMHNERYSLSEETCRSIEQCRSDSGRIVCVGTTAVRTLESAALKNERLRAIEQGQTDLMIAPGFQFRVTDALITNFHLPRSTLLMLVSAFAGREFIMRAYAEATREEYRFYSYGDAMLIL